MYPRSTQARPSNLYPNYERRTSYSNDQPQLYTESRPATRELPRPLEPRPEPRPTLHSSLSDFPGAYRRRDEFHDPLNVHLDLRIHGQNLPSVRDILSPNTQASVSSSYATPWQPSSVKPSSRQSGANSYAHPGVHPPMSIGTLYDPNHRYQDPQTRTFEVPMLETNPVSRQPQSPYGGWSSGVPENADYGTERHDRAPSGPYMTNGVPSPYTPTAPDESQYRTPALERTAPPAYAPASAETQKKYLGVREMPGEGSYHIYEGGHRIPTQVDGDPVNPVWGLTKANKPRKRLALACLDCREKKIKCEPGESSCLQCEKAKRPCRRQVFLDSTYVVANFRPELRRHQCKTTPPHLGQVLLDCPYGKSVQPRILLRCQIEIQSPTP